MHEHKRACQGSITKQQFLAMAPSMAATLGITEEQVSTALAAALDDLTSQASSNSSGMKLQLFHNCRRADNYTAAPCCKRPKRSCAGQLDQQFAPLQTLTPACGAQLQLQLASATDIPSELLCSLFIQISLVTAKDLQATSPGIGQAQTFDDSMLGQLSQCKTTQGKSLLTSGDVAAHHEQDVTFPMQQPSMPLPELKIAGSFTVDQEKMQLLMLAVDQQGQRIDSIAPLLSDTFVVTKQQSPEIKSFPGAEYAKTKCIALPKATAQHTLSDNSEDSEGDAWVECIGDSCMECCFRRDVQGTLASYAHDAISCTSTSA